MIQMSLKWSEHCGRGSSVLPTLAVTVGTMVHGVIHKQHEVTPLDIADCILSAAYFRHPPSLPVVFIADCMTVSYGVVENYELII